MSAKKVLAAGLIVFRRNNQNVEYLVMKHSRGEHWGPPKGHVDPGESDFETALRETSEEAGLTKDQMHIQDGFKTELHYEAFGKPKRVVFWLSEVKDPSASVTLSFEHSEYKWVPLEEACRLLHFKDMIKAVREADDFITKSKKA
ncbi:bis(5'-nucleosyl)-tetraphosphatase [asymmetrical]-like [Babylonia areolata]|uniref:bis(5'-nucleosyl)-tetraphosphatase [asymmetrical]-like n=1 Tax=Babylonia areolata TaxID=304850 RepID=UPI003FD2F939